MAIFGLVCTNVHTIFVCTNVHTIHFYYSYVVFLRDEKIRQKTGTLVGFFTGTQLGTTSDPQILKASAALVVADQLREMLIPSVPMQA